MEALSLFELNAKVRRCLERSLPDEYWVQAELSEVRVHPATGHCYVEFVQKDPNGSQLVAKARGIIWSNVFRLLRPYFEESTGQAFTAGIKVLVQVRIGFHELYGHSLTVLDIDPAYTLGDMARQRREILRRLEDEGVLTLNKELEMPMLPQRVAVVSSATAAGYGDFCHQLQHNPQGYGFSIELFASAMQGERTEESVLTALDLINHRRDDFDVVVIIRGGGATSDLSAFDSYLLAAACAQFPLPIITGIGHERDDTVLDNVVHTRVKTPTAAAEFLIACMDQAASLLQVAATRLQHSVSVRLQHEHMRLQRLRQRIPMSAMRRLAQARLQLGSVQKDLHRAADALLTRQRHRLELWQQRIADANPQKQLARGYSITLKDGHAVTDATQLLPGDILVTRLYKGEIQSTVKPQDSEPHHAIDQEKRNLSPGHQPPGADCQPNRQQRAGH